VSAVPEREISTSAAIALAQASSDPEAADRERLTPGCRFAGTLRPGDAYWFKGQTLGDDGKYCYQQVHRVIVVWGPRLDARPAHPRRSQLSSAPPSTWPSGRWADRRAAPQTYSSWRRIQVWNPSPSSRPLGTRSRTG
jgi:hypothetical protein